MAKKKETQVKPAETPESPSEGNGTVAVAEPAPAPPPVHQNGNGRRPPDISWSLNTDRTTRVELAAWVNLYTNQQGEQYEQVSFQLTRSYRQDDGWKNGGSFRTHDLPIVAFLIAKGHAWACERRVTDSTMPF